ncbi:two-component sensor histidine kinase [Erythrobacter arachoides]|uniref:histidine kinase n=1 Tax=Aurantiacibacter arachoides TaxID=1850444 RepID=A0A845A0R9_9SPHN|nr:ATP-binding protein [Aurantiacibacter arachoides]MXO93314.1 two-component sensor histidine kinase [Aurantiacibacter arachoides]GGD50330.1 two-component sensor histidine kinase [Aurantiacibacter arachoides]
MDARFVPVAGIVLALLCCGVLLANGVDLWVVAGVLTVWIGSFWLAVPPPAAPPPAASDGLTISQSGVRDLIEKSGLPMLLLDGERIIVANAEARREIGQHVTGQDARVALRHPAAIDLLGRERGGAVTVQGLTGPRSNWQMSVQPINTRYRLVELINRTSEADVSRAHTDFVANASHELRTPLSSIIGYLETLEDEGEDIDPALARRFRSTVLREARRLQSLIADLLSLSRVEAEKHDQPREAIDLAQVVRSSARDAAGIDNMPRIEFAVVSGPVPVRGDSNQLEQLVRNLVDNALKYGTPESPVTVSLDRGDRDMAVLQVVDRGDGIDPDHLPHLTRRFYRTDPGRSRAAGGTGLGLAIVKHIVERHRGRLDIESQRGEGTTVTVRLPLAADA